MVLYWHMAPTKKAKIKKIERDDNGLLSNTDYIFTEDGLIDW